MIIGKKFNMFYSGSSKMDWSYEHYIDLLNSTKGMTYSLTPTVTSLGTKYFGVWNLTVIDNKLKLTGLYDQSTNAGKYMNIFDVDTLSMTQVNLPISLGTTNLQHPSVLHDGRVILFSGNDIYVADDIRISNMQKKLTLSGLSSSSHGLNHVTDFDQRYLYVWYNETSKMAKIDLSTFTVQYFTFPLSNWLYVATVLPDDSICFATIGLALYRYSGSSYQTVKTKTYGSYAGWASISAIVIDDGKFIWGACARNGLHNYIDFNTLDSFSTINIGNSDYVSGTSTLLAMIGYDNIMIYVKSGASISTGLYMYHPMKGSVDKLTVSSDIVSKLTSNLTYMKYIGNGKVLVRNTSDYITGDYYLFDFNVDKYMDNSAITSTWFGNI